MKQTITKALVAGGLAFAGLMGSGLQNGSVSVKELTIAAGVGLSTAVATWYFPNAEKK